LSSDGQTESIRSARRFWWCLCIAVVLSGCVYVGGRWSPSSYGIVLRELGVRDTGVIAGIPRVERGDEFAWQTPLLQITLRNGFRRFDHTPPYFEDLRTLYAMPILDWAIVFKPQFWLFFVAAPATAFSFYHFLLMTMFVVGFTILFVRLGGRHLDSLLMALVLFFTAFTQYWWDGSANFLFPFFPWIVLAPLWPIPFGFRLVLLFWLVVCGLLTYFYPPNAICLAFVAVILWGAIRPTLLRLRTLLALGSAAAAAGGLVVFYLRDAIATIRGTIYPGQRISGGGGVNFRWWLSQFLPTSQMNHHVPLVPAPNICELSTIGSVYVLAVVFFVPWKELIRRSAPEERRRWMWLGTGLVATQAWMTIGLPPWVGYPLLWHLVQPGRMVLAGGLLLVTVAFALGQARGLRFSVHGCVAFALALVLGYVAFKANHGVGFREAYRDWIYILPVLGVAALQGIKLLTPTRGNQILIGCAALLGVISFGTFNPIQSTTPIFKRHQTSVTATFDRQLREEGRGYLALPWGTSFFAHAGLPLIALGYPSIAYATFDPAMDLWTRVYPDVPREELNRAFNNVGSVAFGDVPKPRWMPIIVEAPIAPFRQPGATVCDFIRPARSSFASSVGCNARASVASGSSAK
jgi:hypothetical protein